MASFLYMAREAETGREIYGSVDAATQPDAIAVLRNRKEMVVSIEEKAPKQGWASGGRVDQADLVIFTRQLATMIRSGLAIVQSLQALADQTLNKVMRDTIHDVCARVEGGDSFSEALRRHPKAFNRLYVCMVAAGEKGGLLSDILTRLAIYLENSARLRKKIKSAMMYPTFVAVVAIVITTLLLVKVVPVFGEIFVSFKSTLPAPTLYLMQISNFVQSYLVLLLMVAGGGTYAWLYFIKTPLGQKFWDSRRIRLPIFGPIAHAACLARFARTLSSLVRSGVPILEVLQIVSQTVDNVVMENAVKKAALDIERGESMSAALAKHPVFPNMIVRMVSVGEQTGKVDEMLDCVADFLDEEVERAISGLTSLIEPILIVFLGVVVGGMVICLFLPIFKLPDIVGH
jgi:type IV pilus assembly protein PilC